MSRSSWRTGDDVGWDASCVPRPARLETSAAGVFAVGDVRSGSMKRVAAAVGEGSTVIRMVHEHIARLRAAQDPTADVATDR